MIVIAGIQEVILRNLPYFGHSLISNGRILCGSLALLGICGMRMV